MHKRLPVVIAPGFFTSLWPSSLNLVDKLKFLGYDVFTPERIFLSLFSIHIQAVALSQLVDRALQESGSKKCNIIGVSMGGIATLYYLHELGGAEKVKTFIAIATPFQGTWTSLLGIVTIGFFSPSMWELLPTSPLINFLLNKPKPPGVNIYTFVGKKDRLSPPNASTYKYARSKKFSGGHADMCFGLDEEVLEYVEIVLETEATHQSAHERR